jgi:hypothetical protein
LTYKNSPPRMIPRVLSLIGLVGGGIFPLHVICLGGLLTFIALCALAYAVELSTLTNGKEIHMETEKNKTTNVTPNLAVRSVMKTIMAIGASTWSAMALSG